MNTETGELKRFEEGEKIPSIFARIKEELMTDKQRRTMQVSKHDNRSELGKLYGQHRKLSRRERNRRKRMKE